VGGAGANDVTLTVTDDPIFFIVPSAEAQSPGDSVNRSLNAVFILFVSSGGERQVENSQEAVVFQPESTRSQSENSIVDVGQEAFEEVEQTKLRVFFRRVDDVTGKDRPEEYQLPVTDVRDVLDIFRQRNFDNGHYRVYAEVSGTNRVRLMLDLRVQSGKIVPKDFLQEDDSATPAPEEAATPRSEDVSPDQKAQPPGDAPTGVKQPEDGAAAGAPLDEKPNADDQPREVAPVPAPPAASPDELGLVGLGSLATRALARRLRDEPVDDRRGAFSRLARLLRRIRQDAG
jgi:hypothetical protein